MRRHTETNKKRNTDSRYTYTRWTHSTLIFPNICHFPFIRSRSNQTNQHLFDSIRVPFEYSRCFSPLAAIWRRRTLVARPVGRRQLKSLPKKKVQRPFSATMSLVLGIGTCCWLSAERWSGSEVKCWAAIRCHNYTSGQALWYHKMAGRDCV